MKPKLLLIIFILNGFILLIKIPVVEAYVGLCCAHCGGNMPLNIPGGGIPETHEFRFKISQMYMRMGPFRDGTDDIKTTDLLGAPSAGKFVAVPREHRMHMTMASMAYSFTDDFAAMAMLSYKRNDMPMQFNPVITAATGTGGFLMNSDGFGDIKFLGKYRLFADDNLAPTQQLSAVMGLSLPSGKTDLRFDNNPVAAQNGTYLPFKMQMGSGTVDPILGLTYQGSKDPIWYGANVMYTGRFYENNRGYQQGDEVRLDLYTMYQLHPKALVHVQLNGFYEGTYSNEPNVGRLLGHGHVGFNPANPFISPLFDPENYGGVKLNATLGLQYQPIPLHIVELNVGTPIHQNLRGPQLSEDWRIQFSYYVEIPTKKSRRYVGTKPPAKLGF